MNQIFDCRFLNTAQNLSDEDIDSSELQSQLNEFILQAKALLCGHQYLDVSDTFDSLLATFDKVLSGEINCSLQQPQRDASGLPGSLHLTHPADRVPAVLGHRSCQAQRAPHRT